MKPKTINLHIDKIVLEGVGSVNRNQLALSLEKVVLNQQQIAKESGLSINTGVENVIWMLVITGIVASLSAFVIAAWLGRNIGSRLNIIAKRAEDISHGDFSGTPLNNTASDELATLTLAINRMTDSLSSLTPTMLADKLNGRPILLLEKILICGLAKYNPPGPQNWRARDYYLQGKMGMFFYSTYTNGEIRI